MWTELNKAEHFVGALSERLAELETQLAADPYNAAKQKQVEETKERLAYWYTKASALFAAEEERESREEWLEFC